MTKVALIGAGKMGISHLSILGAHPDVDVVGVVDHSRIVTDLLSKYSSFKCFDDYKKMLSYTTPDAVFVTVPTKFHAPIVKDLLHRKIHVFVEKPFCLDSNDGIGLVNLARENNLVNQVGYHNKFIGTFEEAKHILNNNWLGDIFHFSADMNGPVVVKRNQNTWRTKINEGGGCLMDYAAHMIDLINYLIAPVTYIRGSILKRYFSTAVEDGVYSLLETENGVTGVLNVNWSDDTYRKMSTSITVLGSKGKLIVDSTELKIYFKDFNVPVSYSKGWNIKHINEFAENVNFYLRGEEYSAQVDYFIKAVQGIVPNNKNTFESAWNTDKVISQIKNY